MTIDDKAFVSLVKIFTKEEMGKCDCKSINNIIDAKNSLGENILHILAMDSNIDISKVDCLVKCGIDINDVDKCGYTPLANAVISNNKKLVKFLLEKGADLRKRYDMGNTIAHLAVNANSLETLKILSNAGVNLYAVNDLKENLLHISLSDKELNPLSHYLIYNKVPIDHKNVFGETPLDIAEENNNLEILYDLLNKTNNKR